MQISKIAQLISIRNVKKKELAQNLSYNMEKSRTNDYKLDINEVKEEGTWFQNKSSNESKSDTESKRYSNVEKSDLRSKISRKDERAPEFFMLNIRFSKLVVSILDWCFASLRLVNEA